MNTEIASPSEGGQGAEGAASSSEGDSSPPPEPFYKSIKDPALRGYAEVKGYKHTDAADFGEALLKSYQNLEKLRGVPEERLMVLPENMEDAEAIKPILAKLGYVAPETADGYEFASIEGADANQAKALADIAFKHGIPAAQAKAVFADVVAMEAQAKQQILTEISEEAAADLGRLQGKWGAKYNENMEVARRAVRMFGFSEEDLTNIETSVGAGGLMEKFHNAGLRLSEGSFVDGSNPNKAFAMTAEGASAKRAQLMGDKDFMAKFLGGDRAAKEQMSRLNQIIAGSQVSA